MGPQRLHITSFALFALVSACTGGADKVQAPAVSSESLATEAPAQEAGTWRAEGDVAMVLKALSTKTPEPRCQDVEELTTNATDAYRQIIENVTEPGFTPMRAATCLMSGHPREAEADALAWVADPARASLTTLALGRLDALPLESAKTIALAALAGPHANIARVRIGRLRNPELKVLAAGNE